ncbi:MAG: hypothetical protein V4505_00695 [Pseudomonadota bacterium]
MGYAVIDNGMVVNIAEANAVFAASQGWIDGVGAAIGDLWDGTQFSKPPAPPPAVPQSVAMWKARTVLLDVDGQNLNPRVDQLIAALPEPYQSAAKVKWDYAGFVDRTDSLVLALIQQTSLTEERTDALFIQAATL